MTSSQPTPSRAGMSAARREQLRALINAAPTGPFDVLGVNLDKRHLTMMFDLDATDEATQRDVNAVIDLLMDLPATIREVLDEIERRETEVVRVAAMLPRAWDEREKAEADRDEARSQRDLAYATADELRRQVRTIGERYVAVLAACTTRDERLDAVRELHQPYEAVTFKGDLLTICGTCCTDAYMSGPDGGEQTMPCAVEHDHGPGRPICATIAVLDGGAGDE